MGLDMIDIGMSIEKEFNVYIADEDYAAIKTVGDLEVYIADHSTDVWPCPHIPAFSRLQAGLMGITDCSIDEIRLESPLSNFSAPTERIAFWQQLADETGLKLPLLQTRAVFATIGCSLGLAWFCSPFLILFELISVTHFLLILLSLFIVPIFCMPIIDHFIQKFIRYCSERYSWAAPVFPTLTIRELTRAVASRNLHQLVTPVSKHHKEIWPRLVPLLINTLGVDEDEVVPEARFIEDLNC